MELRNRDHSRDGIKIFFNSLQKISIRSRSTTSKPTKLTPQMMRAIKGICFIVVGVALSMTAHRSSYFSGAAFFSKDAWPRRSVWIQMLKSKNFNELSPSQGADLLKNHPDPYALNHDIWIREDNGTVYISASPYKEGQSEFWTRLNKTPHTTASVNWIRLGSGITAFNELAKKLDEIEPLQTKRNWVDPKEIRY